jgi:UDP-N-acetyl-D-mannosaminuronic acid dehydrogenase
MKIGIVGLGYVGLTLAIAAADKGIKVFGVDTNKEIINSLLNKKAHFFEPNLDYLIEKNINKNFFLVDEFDKNLKLDAFIITVGTPLKDEPKVPNFDYIKQSLDTIIQGYNGNELIILRSTVSVGTTDEIVIPYLKMKKINDPLIAFCPERTIEGKALIEITSLPQIIGSNNNSSMIVAKKIFSLITPKIIETNSIKEAELIKLYNNVYRDSNFALGNIFSQLAQQFGVNGLDVITKANLEYNRSNIALPGYVGGPCLEKDSYILTNNVFNSKEAGIIMALRHYNESIEDKVIEWVKNLVQEKRLSKNISISGLAFKGQPETSDLRGSNSVSIARKLYYLGYNLLLHDFVANENDIQLLNIGKYTNNVDELFKFSNVVIILNNNLKYNLIEINDDSNDKYFYILDSWNVCKNINSSNKKIKIYNLGNISIKGLNL